MGLLSALLWRLGPPRPTDAGRQAFPPRMIGSQSMTESPLSRPLTGRIAVVTGAARGIGRAAAVALSRAGADVVGIDVAARVSSILDFEPATVEDLTHTGELVKAAGGRWRQHVADQRDIDAVRATADAVVQEWGGVDIVFANAGIQAFKPLLEMSDADGGDQIAVNLSGTQK